MLAKIPMTATKIKRYAGKALRAGDPFEASRSDARALVAARLATYATTDQARAPSIVKEATTVTPPPADDPAELAALRADYEAIAERKPFGFWKADKLRAEVEKLRGERDVAPSDEAASGT